MAKTTTETKKCKKCMEEINKKAKRCPKCGANRMPGWLKFLIIIGVVFFMCVSCMSSCANSVSDAIEETEQEYKDEYADKNGKKSFKSGEYFQNKYIKITLDSVNTNFKKYSEYSKPTKGYKVVQFVFTAENIGDDDQYFDYTDFNCYADDVIVDEYIWADDGTEFGGDISSGKKTTGTLYYEVPSNAKKSFRI